VCDPVPASYEREARERVGAPDVEITSGPAAQLSPVPKSLRTPEVKATLKVIALPYPGKTPERQTDD